MFTAELKLMAYSAARETDNGGALLRPNVASYLKKCPKYPTVEVSPFYPK
jgi:hypothetical protein